MSANKIIRAGNTELLLCFFRYLARWEVAYPTSDLHPFLNHMYRSSGYYDQADYLRYQVIAPPLEAFLEHWQASLKDSELLVLQDTLNHINAIAPAQKSAFLESLATKQITYRNSFDYDLLTERVRAKHLLIISPFTPLIEQQYRLGNLAHVRPQFAPSSIASYRFPYLFQHRSDLHSDLRSDFRSDFDSELDSNAALLRIQNEIDQVRFHHPQINAAVLSCGCYGAPLAHHLAQQGIDVYYFGGDLQIYFGIMGGRWRQSFAEQAWFAKNQAYWIMQIPAEFIPPQADEIERGCYW
jgi:hypothetical protein